MSRRAKGQIVKNELRVLAAAMSLRAIGQNEFHGYSLNKQFENENQKTFTVSTLYRCLNRLEGMGLLTSESAPAEGRGPSRRSYKLTGEGVRVASELDTQNLPDGNWLGTT